MTPEADRGDELIASSTPESKGEALSAKLKYDDWGMC